MSGLIFQTGARHAPADDDDLVSNNVASGPSELVTEQICFSTPKFGDVMEIGDGKS